MTKPNTPNLDWEISEDYYSTDENQKELKLEDFMDENADTESEDFGNTIASAADEALQRTVHDVHQVMALAGQGLTTEQIAKELELDHQYVYDIQVTAQGFHEDDEIATAHLVMMK